MKKRAREMLAGPVYFVAFCFHLLCGLFTWLADWIAGEHAPNIVTLLILGWAGLIGFAASKADPNPPDVFLSSRQDYFNIPHGFSAEQIKVALPAIRNNACLEAIGAVRTTLKPNPVGFEPCTIDASYAITISEDLQDITVSGDAIGVARKPFTVILQHYPPAIWAGGFMVNDIRFNERAEREEAPKPH